MSGYLRERSVFLPFAFTRKAPSYQIPKSIENIPRDFSERIGHVGERDGSLGRQQGKRRLSKASSLWVAAVRFKVLISLPKEQNMVAPDDEVTLAIGVSPYRGV